MRPDFVFSDSSISPSFFFTTPAKKPRTECGCHPVTFEIAHVVLDQVLATIIAKASGKTLHQSNRPIGGAKQKRSRIRRHQSSIEGGVHRAAFHDSKIKPFCATLCRHRGFLESLQKSLRHNNFR